VTPRFGYTAGVFDMFHIGHLNLLRAARVQCDWLIVGVTTDDLCLAAKGKLPVVPEAERVEILRAVRFVDQVVAQRTMDKLAARDEVHFDVIFVGDDWRGSPTWAALEVALAASRGEVVYLPYTRHTSSTRLRAEVHSRQG
jgi:glycerol-3-phosphate cytidylyltransferase